MRAPLLLTLSLLVACGPGLAGSADVPPPPGPVSARPGADDAGPPGDEGASPPGRLGPWVDPATGDLVVRVRSERATRLAIEVFAHATGEDAALREVLVRSTDEPVWTAHLAGARLRAAGLAPPYLYGLRAWGPNWTYDAAWSPGSHAGFVADVDADGHHFDPNKLLVDPHARELTHDPISPAWKDFGPFMGGEGHRDEDSAPMAPKSVALQELESPARPAKPTRAFADDVVYEAHVRGLTRLDPLVPEDERGTYAGAARKAKYLRDLGVTAIELLPIHETQNEQNDWSESTDGDNYWGYSSLSFFAPERRYARDRSLGGPTRELRAMVDAFHAEGIKVLLDVVYNHTAEGKAGSDPGRVPLLSLRGLDGPNYYLGAPDRRFDMDHNGVGADLAVARPGTRDLVLASLAYYVEEIGVDGFRFDLASVLGNRCEVGCFAFDAGREGGLLREIPARLGARVDLVAEPWAIGEGTYQLGRFPAGWAEWNDQFRGAIRRAQNRFGVADVPLGELATRMSGSPDVFGARGARAGVSFVVAHDGMTLADLYSYDGKQNGQPWPFGPSDGGTDDDLAWSQGGDRIAQVRAARVGMALLAVSRGTPMLVMGDERRRTQRGNNNAYNLDAAGSWMDWSSTTEADAFAAFTRALLAQRAALAALRSGFAPQGKDGDGDGLADVTWLRADGAPVDDATWASASAPLVVRLDAREADAASAVRSVLVVYQRAPASVSIALPKPRAGLAWRRAVDTSAPVPAVPPGAEEAIPAGAYLAEGRSAVVLVER